MRDYSIKLEYLQLIAVDVLREGSPKLSAISFAFDVIPPMKFIKYVETSCDSLVMESQKSEGSQKSTLYFLK